MEHTELGHDGVMERRSHARCRLNAAFEEALRVRLECVLAPFEHDLNPDDTAIIIDGAIDAFTEELERVTT